jgi:hypothetical protein
MQQMNMETFLSNGGLSLLKFTRNWLPCSFTYAYISDGYFTCSSTAPPLKKLIKKLNADRFAMKQPLPTFMYWV